MSLAADRLTARRICSLVVTQPARIFLNCFCTSVKVFNLMAGWFHVQGEALEVKMMAIIRPYRPRASPKIGMRITPT